MGKILNVNIQPRCCALRSQTLQCELACSQLRAGLSVPSDLPRREDMERHSRVLLLLTTTITLLAHVTRFVKHKLNLFIENENNKIRKPVFTLDHVMFKIGKIDP